MATLATLQARLAEAEAAQHQLAIGAREVSVGNSSGASDVRVTYTAAKMAELQAYIDSLKAQIAAAGGTTSGSRRRALEVDL